LFKNTTCRGEYYAEIHNKELNGRETAAFDLILVLKTYHINPTFMTDIGEHLYIIRKYFSFSIWVQDKHGVAQGSIL